MSQLPVTACLEEASRLPLAYFLAVTLVYFVVLVRKDGLSLGQALLELFGLRGLKRDARTLAFAGVAIIPTLGMTLWFSAECRAALT